MAGQNRTPVSVDDDAGPGYVEPYVERGRRAEETKKLTVTIPVHVLKLLTDERTRRQVKKLRHATISELLTEAFLHAYTGQPLPTDEELSRPER
jgi:MetJ family methionine regulon transcriptional repressor